MPYIRVHVCCLRNIIHNMPTVSVGDKVFEPICIAHVFFSVVVDVTEILMISWVNHPLAYLAIKVFLNISCVPMDIQCVANFVFIIVESVLIVGVYVIKSVVFLLFSWSGAFSEIGIVVSSFVKLRCCDPICFSLHISLSSRWLDVMIDNILFLI